MAEPDFAKGASPAPGYDTTPGGLGLSPAYLGGATATATGSGSSGSSVGWSDVPGTFAYSSADGPTGVVTTSTDLTGTISLGARIRLAQTTAKYFIVTAIDATTITMYGGTDYTLANAVITLPSYSLAKSPVGFNPSPAKWTVEVTDSSDRLQASPVSGTWYNNAADQISVPIGGWRLSYQATIFAQSTGTGDTNLVAYATLSTANNTESDTDLTSYAQVDGSVITTTDQKLGATFNRSKIVVVAAKTAYFLNAKYGVAGGNQVGFIGSNAPTKLRAECAYL